jgi:hypothetical protein
MSGTIPALPHTPSWRGAQLQRRDNFFIIIIIISLGYHVGIFKGWNWGVESTFSGMT